MNYEIGWRRMFPRFILHTSYFIISLLVCLCASSRGEELKRQLPVNQAWKLELAGGAAERHVRDPRGYAQHGAGKRVFTQRITLTNTGPVPLTGRLLVVDGKDWSSQDALAKSLRLPTQPRALVESFYTFWKDQHSHASSGTDAAEDPIGVLNFWGYTLCGEDTHALNRFFLKKAGIPGRRIALNGHTVGEYFYDDAWHVVDGDQVACYLKLDNRTLASAADIVADPLLALRTKVLGKHAPVSQSNSAFNSSLFEFIEPRDNKPMRVKTPDIALPAETLWPGEKIIYHADRAPEQPVGKTNLGEWEGVRESALCLVEWVIDPKARRADAAGNLTLRFAYPIVSTQVRDSGVALPVAKGDPVFELTFKASAVAGPVSVFCQRSRASMPTLDSVGSQLMVVASDARGQAQLDVEYQPCVGPKPPEVASNNVALPQFAVTADPDADRLWWQVAANAEFSFVAPNFDNVSAKIDSIVFDPLTATFFNRDQPYFLRAKIRRKSPEGAVWSEWSAPIQFKVALPARPSPVRSEVLAGGRVRLSWPAGAPDTEYLVYGSNRLDFVPEPYATEEIVAMRDGVIKETRPNKNLVIAVKEPKVELAASYRFYRVLAKKDGMLSTPSELITLPASGGAAGPALVLQDRWTKETQPKAKNGYVDVHIASETKLPR